MNKPLSKLEQFRASRLVPKSKRLREHREATAQAALARDIEIALYTAIVQRANAHNLARGAYVPAPRASPAVH